MDFALTEEQTALRDAARAYLDDTYPPDRIAEFADGAGTDADGWPELVRQGWLDPELGAVEYGLLAVEGGRALHPVPWFATAGLALPVYRAAGLGLPGPATLADDAGPRTAVRTGSGWSLDGTAVDVPDARAAAEIIVTARTGAGDALFGVRPDAPGMTITTRGGLDPLRPLSGLAMTGTPARLLVAAPTATSLLTGVRRRAAFLLACEAVGVADRALEIAVRQARVRTQFGRPIGSFQAVSHQLADSYADAELARSLAFRAACLLDDTGERTGETVDPAIACAAHAGVRAAVAGCETAIQVCGGLGVCWEFPLHRWLRRALWLDAVLTARTTPLDTIADAVFTASN